MGLLVDGFWLGKRGGEGYMKETLTDKMVEWIRGNWEQDC